MRAHRKRPWAELVVNMTPLIDVVFLIIIFFIIMINFSERHIRNVALPNADEAEKSQIEQRFKIPLTIKSKEVIFLERTKVSLDDLAARLASGIVNKEIVTIQVRADESVPYEVIKEVMIKMAQVNISKIEFSTYRDEPTPLTKE
jgi:biopolymer transport protein ExbD